MARDIYELRSGRWAVILSSQEMKTAREVAVGRWNEYQRMLEEDGRPPGPMGIEGFGTHYQGVVAEIAAGEFYDAPPELIVGRFDDGVDLWMDGKSLGIKSTYCFNHPDHELALLVPENQGIKCDAYLLAAVEVERAYCELIGLATKQQLLEKKPARWGDGTPVSRWVEEPELRRPRPPVPKPLPTAPVAPAEELRGAAGGLGPSGGAAAVKTDSGESFTPVEMLLVPDEEMTVEYWDAFFERPEVQKWFED